MTDTTHLNPTDQVRADERARKEAEKAAIARRNALLDDATKNRTDGSALKDIPPLGFTARLIDGYDPSQPETFLEKSVEVTPTVNPLLDAALVSLIGATKRGTRSYSLSGGEKADPATIAGLLEVLPARICYVGSHEPQAAKKGFFSFRGRRRSIGYDVIYELRELPAFNKLPFTSFNSEVYQDHPTDDAKTPLSKCALVLSVKKDQLYVKVCTARPEATVDDGLFFADHLPDIDLLRPEDQRKDAIRVTPDVAVEILDHAQASGYPIDDETGDIAALRAALRNAVIGQQVAGAPGQSRVVVGNDIPAIKGVKLPEAEDGFTARSLTTTAKEAASVVAAASSATLTALHPLVQDVMAMYDAKPVGREGLRPYQDEAVSLHLSTEIGYVNACEVGLGKTVMALSAMREKAQVTPNYKALVAVPATLRTQWEREAGRFFPEARVAAIAGGNLAKQAIAHYREAAEAGAPAVVICSHEAMRKGHEALIEHFQATGERLDDMLVDEAAILSSTSAGRSKAATALRPYAKVGVALTGTPIDKSLDDLGGILAWARNDSELFYGKRLSQRFDLSAPGAVDALWSAIGPTVFRRDRSEIADELPAISTEVIALDPTPEERKLIAGARNRLKEIYQGITDKVAKARELDPDDPQLKAVQEELQKARGTVLGGITLARMAAVDAEAVAESDSPAAALLKAAGLIAPAVAKGATKRTAIAGLTSDLVDNGEAVLIFTDFARAAVNLSRDLEEMGVRVATFKGGQGDKARDKAIVSFQGAPCAAHAKAGRDATCGACTQPTVDAMVLTKSAKEGLNLQRASVLIHLDLPWVPSDVVQRVGRATRIGSTNEHLQVLIPIMAGTVESRVADRVAARAAEAILALDAHRDTQVAGTVAGQLVAGVADHLKDDPESAASKGLFDMLGEILSDEFDAEDGR